MVERRQEQRPQESESDVQYEAPELTALGTVDEVTQANEATLGAIDSGRG